MAYDFSKGLKRYGKIGSVNRGDGLSGIKSGPNSPFVPRKNPHLLAEYFESESTGGDSSRLLDTSRFGTRRTGQEGRGYLYDGVDDYSVMDSEITLSGDFSISWHQKATSFAAPFHVFYKASTDRIYFNGSNSFRFVANNLQSIITISPSLVAGTDYHLVLVRSSGQVTLYIDGVAQADVETNANDFDMLQVSRSDTDKLNAKVFDIRIFDFALTQTEIDFVRTFGRSGTDSGLPIHWWKCDEQAGVIGYDSVGGNNLTHNSITTATFHSTQDIYSFQNQVGYNEGRNLVQSSLTLGTGWGKLNITITSGISDPEGGTNAHKVEATSTSSTSFTQVVPSLAKFSGYYVYSCYIKKGSSATDFGYLNLRINSGPRTGNIATGVINFDTGVLNVTGNANAGGQATIVGDGWYLVEIYDDTIVAGDAARIYIATGGGSSNSGIFAYFYAPQLEAGTQRGLTQLTGVYYITEDTILPSDESDPTKDVLGNPLTYTGRRPNDAALINSNCVTINGTNQIVLVPHSSDLDISDNLTVSVWAKNNDSALSGAVEYLLSRYATTSSKRIWGLAVISAGNYLSAQIGNSAGTSATTQVSTNAVVPDAWNHYAFTFSGGVVKLYNNGALLSSAGAGHMVTLYDTDVDLSLGSSFSIEPATTNRWDGQIFDARIYAGDSTVLTDAQILSIYENPTGNINFDGQTLAAHYKLAEGAGVTCYDSSGNGNHGTITKAVNNWGVTQDLVHSNLLNGFSLYEHASSDPIRVPFDSTGNPISITPPTGYTLTGHFPSGSYHNNAEAEIDFNPDSTPEMTNIYTESVFNGTSSHAYVTNNSVLNFTDNLSVSCWAKHDSQDISTQSDTLVSMYENTGNLQVWRMEITTDQLFRFMIGNSAGSGMTNETADVAHPIDSWNHYLATFDEGVVKLYINGELQSSTTSSAHAASLNGRSGPLVLGAFNWSAGGGSQQGWDGSIRNIRIYKGDSSPLSSSQISRDMMETESQPRFDDQTVIASYDLVKDTLDRSGNSLNATNNGITFTQKTLPSAYSFGTDLGSDGIISKTSKFEGNEWGAVFDANSYINIGDRKKLKITIEPFEIEATIRLTGTGAYDIFSKYQTASNKRCYRFYVSNGELFFTTTSNGSTTATLIGSVSVNDGEWHKVKAVRETASSTTVKLYIDSVEDTGTAGAIDSSIFDSNSFASIGAYNLDATPAGEFDGNIRDLKVTVGGVVVGHWELSKDTRDSSPNDYHGENTGVTFYSPISEYSMNIFSQDPFSKYSQFGKKYNKSRLYENF